MNSRAVGYLLVVPATGAALLLRWILAPYVGSTSPFMFFAFSVAASALPGGLLPGLLATLLGICAGEFLFASPMPGGELPLLANPMRIGLFVLLGIQISLVSEVLLRTAERAKRQSRIIEKILRSSPDWASLVDRSGRYIHVSPAAASALGRPPHAILGRLPSELGITSELAERLESHHAAVLATGHSATCEIAAVVEGRTREWECVFVPVRDGQGVVEAVAMVGRDVTERNCAQRALRESEAKFRAVFSQAAIGIARVGLDGRWLEVNRALCEITGYSEAELLALTFQQITHPEDLDEDLAYAAQLLRGESSSYTMDKRYIRRDGSAVWVRLSGSVVRDAKGDPLYGVAVIRDITAQKRMEQALQQSENRYRTLFEESPISLWEEDFSQVKAYLDELRSSGVRDVRAFLRMHPEEVGRCLRMVKVLAVNRATFDMYRAQGPEDMFANFERIAGGPALDTHIESIAAVAEGKRCFETETLNRTLDGDPIYVNMRWAVPEADAATYSKAIVSISDLTARREAELDLQASEERFRSVFADAAVGMSIVSLDGRLMRTNRMFRDILGYSEQELTSKTYLDITHPDDRENSRQHVRRLLAGQVPSFVIQKRYLAKDGSIIWAQSSVSLAHDAHGGPANLVCLIENITERIQSMERTTWLLEQVISSQEHERKRLARELHDGVSQSLASLLAGLLSFDDIADMDAAKRRAHDLRAAAGAALDELRHLVSGLRPSVLDDLGLYAALDRHVREFVTYYGVDVRLDAEQIRDRRLPPAVETTLYRIVQESLTNVAKHAAARSAQVCVELEPEAIELIVEDDGIGFDVEDAMAREISHIGLHSIRERVALLGGSLSIDSVPNDGTTLIVRVPFKPIPAARSRPET